MRSFFYVATLVMACLTLTTGCATAPPPAEPVTTTKTTTTVPSVVEEAQYVEVNTKKLATSAFFEDYKGKYVVFEGYSIGSPTSHAGALIVAVRSEPSTLDNAFVSVRVPKAMADVVFDWPVEQWTHARVYGKAEPLSARIMAVTASKIEVLDGSSAEQQSVATLIEFARQAMARPEFDATTAKALIGKLREAKPKDDVQKQAIDQLIAELETKQ